MDVKQLQLFVETVKLGSFAAVARGEGVDPSSVSRQIASLEERLGVRLFQRTTRSLSLTEEGEAYWRRVEPLLEELARAEDAVQMQDGQPRGGGR
ncbi:MAG TPA: LysR family transcriptional regulator, partial [Hyphomonadaceae bacterium]|nr:LysR family transcriptional regulator [Hyphomonadaceae bacterium]